MTGSKNIVALSYRLKNCLGNAEQKQVFSMMESLGAIRSSKMAQIQTTKLKTATSSATPQVRQGEVPSGPSPVKSRRDEQ